MMKAIFFLKYFYSFPKIIVKLVSGLPVASTDKYVNILEKANRYHQEIAVRYI